MNKTIITILISLVALIGVGVFVFEDKPEIEQEQIVTQPALLPGETAVTEEVVPTPVVVVPFIVPLPESFKGVEMVTEKNEYFEITLPKKWVLQERVPPAKRADEYMRYFISPNEQTNAIAITVGATEGLPIAEIDKNYIVEGYNETLISVNGEFGVYTKGGEGVDSYDFVQDGKYYIMRVYLSEAPSKLAYAGLHEDEIRWIVSTFKITGQTN
ncbi:MAG: hypothetical protein RLZZ230_502 [Candidatus Parcubacteria bacterium]|jgi:hypothetical protein